LITHDEFLRVFILASAAIIIVTVAGFFVFMSWSKRDTAKRNAAVRFYNRQFKDDPKDSD
jgi:hypothetical protein